MAAPSNSAKRIGLWLMVIGGTSIVLSITAALTMLGMDRIDQSLSRLLAVLSAHHDDLRTLALAGQGAAAVVGGLVLVLAGSIVLRLSGRQEQARDTQRQPSKLAA